MTTTLYVNSTALPLSCGGGDERIEDRAQNAMQDIGFYTPVKYVLDVQGVRMKLSNMIQGQTYVAYFEGCDWVKSLVAIKKAESAAQRNAENILPPNVDLPPGVITNLGQLTGGQKQSIFGSIAPRVLVDANVVNERDLDDLDWVKKKLLRGLTVEKCARNSAIKPLQLVSNKTFTSLSIGRNKTIVMSDVTGVEKGKASKELDRASGVNSDRCIVLRTNKRTLSLIMKSRHERDRFVCGLETLFQFESSDVSSVSDSSTSSFKKTSLYGDQYDMDMLACGA